MIEYRSKLVKNSFHNHQMTCGRSLCAWPSLPTSQKKKKTLTLVTSFQWNMSSTPKRRCQAAGVRGRPLSVSFEYVLSDE